MLVDIFSTFDDQNQVFMSFYFLMWVYSFVVIMLFSSSLWVSNMSWIWVVNVMKDTIASQIFRSFGFNLGGFLNLITGLFLFLIFVNLSGLIPYVFSPTSHLVVSFSLGFPLWLSLILSGGWHNLKSVVASLLPMGAPFLLNPFLVVIETVSIMVRSITLSVRLIANMSAGHIVLTLIGNYLMAGVFSSMI
uniref:ATP synthase subunit a n=1 Tax=Viviparus chui TaxID=2023714 RepID=A0A343FMR1_9CAEN|nr:ATP synthase F0 subunit 6 [Viviparus chui]ASR74841.1 ATP synthase F0 subunit 6 [Viviparus chui]